MATRRADITGLDISALEDLLESLRGLRATINQFEAYLRAPRLDPPMPPPLRAEIFKCALELAHDTLPQDWAAFRLLLTPGLAVAAAQFNPDENEVPAPEVPQNHQAPIESIRLYA